MQYILHKCVQCIINYTFKHCLFFNVCKNIVSNNIYIYIYIYIDSINNSSGLHHACIVITALYTVMITLVMFKW